MSKIEVDAIEPQSGTTLTIGASGDTITVPSGATITNSGTATGFGGTNTPAFEATLSSDQTPSNDVNALVVHLIAKYLILLVLIILLDGKFTPTNCW
jgi:hypothetical protein